MSAENKKNKKSREEELDKLQAILGIKFNDKRMLNQALIHRSYLNEHSLGLPDNERLEYLGDSVLGLVVNEYLFKRFESYNEGELAKIKSVVVSENTLSEAAIELGIGQFLLMGKGEDITGGRERSSILANALEAIIGAYYLDSGFKDLRRFVLGFLKKHIERINSMTYQRDPKTTLQEYVQKKYKARPVYEVISESGPDHSKEFNVRLLINDKEIITGVGGSKRKAESAAAASVLRKIEKGDINI
ncbi:MAG: ribonuclease III [Leptospirales bacterium]|nr:ribonuclease III [Leptospirales bacterium]